VILLLVSAGSAVKLFSVRLIILLWATDVATSKHE